jgi:hypothetical protein
VIVSLQAAMLAVRPLDRPGMMPLVFYPVLLAAVRQAICQA